MIVDTLVGLVVDDGVSVVRECRRCGTSPDGDDVCPHCGPDTDIVEHRLD